MLDINIWEIVLYIVNIIILFFFLRWLLYKPISKFLQNRTDTVQKQLNEAAKKQADAEQLKVKYDEMMAEAHSVAQDIIEQGRTLADQQAERIVSEANAEAAEMRARASRLIEEEKRQAVLEMRYDVTKLAIQIAEKVLRREVSYKDNKEIIDEFFEKVS